MKNSKSFNAGDETDKQLVIAISHQFLRAESAFARFINYMSSYPPLDKVLELEVNRIFIPERQWQVDVYNAYADFIHHLYEYMIGCFKRGVNSLDDIDHKRSDILIVREAEKYRNQCLVRIRENKDKEYGLNDISYYIDPVPEDFGMAFRNARNMNAHADIRRVNYRKEKQVK
ncbi:MAG: hypothetical protein KBF93_06935 [Leptospiraceae bacterium]|nr:hypothetical protein [Leptospiraceae bacterium]